MRQWLRSNMSYANVMSSIAVFAVLAGGSAWAAAKIGAGDIKRNAIHSKHIKRKAVTRAKLATPTLFGNFRGDDGSLARGKGIVSSQRNGTGFYVVRFNRSISRCTLLAGPSSTNGTNPSSRTVGAAYFSGNDRAFVLIRNDFNDNRDDADFSLAAFC
jgi:hypothetical protein